MPTVIPIDWLVGAFRVSAPIIVWIALLFWIAEQVRRTGEKK